MKEQCVWTGKDAKKLRVELGLTQVEFAEASGIPLGSIAAVESRSKNKKLSAAFQYVYIDIESRSGDFCGQLDTLRKQIMECIAQKRGT